MINLVVDSLEKKDDKVEFVEVKGFGHPDTICDDIAESCSQVLTKYYLKQFGRVLYHNFDKVSIIAGRSIPKFGGGEIKKPMRIVVSGRAVSKVGNVIVSVEETIKKVVGNHMALFDVDYDLEINVQDGAQNLKQGFDWKVEVANDSSISVGYYPFTKLEKLTKDVAELLVSDSFRKKFLGVGYDVKVMGVRIGDDISLTVAMAFISKYVKDMMHYKEMKHEIKSYLENWANVAVRINTIDSFDNENNLYLTVSGLSAEHGDDGMSGRGNRYNGLINPSRPMSVEAYAGKNVRHPGILYQALAGIIAKEVVEKAKGVKCEVGIVTEIGKVLDEPFVVSVKAERVDLKLIKEIVDETFKNIELIKKDLIFS